MIRATVAAVGLLALAGCTASADVITYDLPAESARYSFAAETNGVKTVWEYTSARPTTADNPKSQPCIADVLIKEPGPCRPEPLIFLRYDLGLELDNTTRADGLHPITVTAYYQDRLSTPPIVTKLKVDASFDGGKTWRPMIVQAGAQNTFTAQVLHPPAAEASAGVGLRISATDSAGNTVEQAIPKAYQLR